MLFNWVGIAHDWHRFPSELGICSPHEDPIFMAAYTRQKRLMQSYEDQLRQDEANKTKPTIPVRK